MIVWALPRLARRFGVPPVSALWLGAANPLRVCGTWWSASHNEALMIGLMLAGFELALRHLPKVRPGEPIPPVTTAGAAVAGRRWRPSSPLGAAVKISAAPALGFLGVMVARRWGAPAHDIWCWPRALFGGRVRGDHRGRRRVGTGLGFGWISALSTNGLVKSWMSPMTGLGFLAGGLGIAFGLGNHSDTHDRRSCG